MTFYQGFEAIRDIRLDSTSCNEEILPFVQEETKITNPPLKRLKRVNMYRSKTGFCGFVFLSVLQDSCTNGGLTRGPSDGPSDGCKANQLWRSPPCASRRRLLSSNGRLV